MQQAKDQARMYYESARGNSKNPLKYPNPRTAEEQQRYFKLMDEQESKYQKLYREYCNIDNTER